jgi:hypothetical protein
MKDLQKHINILKTHKDLENHNYFDKIIVLILYLRS